MFLKNKNIIFKIRRSKVTDYAALSEGQKYAFGYMFLFLYSFTFKNLSATVGIVGLRFKVLCQLIQTQAYTK